MVAPLFFILLALYFFVYTPNQPEYILNHAAIDMLTTNQVSFTQLQGVIVASKDAPSLTLTGTQSASGALNVAVKIASPNTATFTLQSTDGKKFFIRGVGLENLPRLFPSDTNLAPLVHAKADQWYAIDHNILASSMKNILTLWQLHVGGGDVKKYQDAYSSSEFFSVNQVLSPEKIANRQTNHYKVSVDSKKFDTFVKAFAASKPTDSILLTNLRALHPDGKDFEVWVATTKNSKSIVQLATPNVNGHSYVKLAPTHAQAPAVIEPTDGKTLTQLQKEYDDGVAAAKAAQEQEAATQTSVSSSNNTISPGFNAWSQEYNFQNYILPNIW